MKSVIFIIFIILVVVTGLIIIFCKGSITLGNKFQLTFNGGMESENQKISLSDITKKYINDIKKLTTNKSLMSKVGNGQSWDDKKIKRFIKYNEQDAKIIDPKQRKNFYWGIIYNNHLIGVVGIHSVNYNKSNLYTTIFINPKYQGMGIGTNSLRLAIAKFKSLNPHIKYIYSNISPDNKNSILLHKKIGFIDCKKIQIISKKEFMTLQYKLS